MHVFYINYAYTTVAKGLNKLVYVLISNTRGREYRHGLQNKCLIKPYLPNCSQAHYMYTYNLLIMVLTTSLFYAQNLYPGHHVSFVQTHVVTKAQDLAMNFE